MKRAFAVMAFLPVGMAGTFVAMWAAGHIVAWVGPFVGVGGVIASIGAVWSIMRNYGADEYEIVNNA